MIHAGDQTTSIITKLDPILDRYWIEYWSSTGQLDLSNGAPGNLPGSPGDPGAQNKQANHTGWKGLLRPSPDFVKPRGALAGPEYNQLAVIQS